MGGGVVGRVGYTLKSLPPPLSLSLSDWMRRRTWRCPEASPAAASFPPSPPPPPSSPASRMPTKSLEGRSGLSSVPFTCNITCQYTIQMRLVSEVKV